MKKILSFIAIICLSTLFVNAQTARSVTKDMLAAIDNAKRLQYDMKQSERIDGEIYINEIFTKINVSPLKIYIDNVKGANEGKELLYIEGERNDKVYINVLFGVSLSPFNKQVRKNQHHTVLESGFGVLRNAVANAERMADAQNAFDQVFTLEGTTTFNGKSCHKLVLNDPTFKYVSYTMKGDESLYDISMKKIVNEQLIVEKNSSLSNFYDGKDGLTIQIPSSYAKKTILYIDKATMMPIYQEMHDDRGMFEKYEFSNLKINPAFTSIDFSDDNEKYDF